MPEFTIRFLKRVSNDVGWENEICQRRMSVEATDAAQAVAAGQRQFCMLERIPDWTTRADRFELLLPDDAAEILSDPGFVQTERGRWA
jgi:hypothetical protein